MKQILGLVAAVLLVSSPVMAQNSGSTPETPPAGTVVVMAGIYDGVDIIPMEQYIIVPPLACDPA